MASIPAIATKLVVFDTNIVDLTRGAVRPDRGAVLRAARRRHRHQPGARLLRTPRHGARQRTHLVLISDLYEGGIAEQMLARCRAMVTAGVNVIVLLALNDDGRPAYDANHAALLAALGCPVFACTPASVPRPDGGRPEAAGPLGLGGRAQTSSWCGRARRYEDRLNPSLVRRTQACAEHLRNSGGANSGGRSDPVLANRLDRPAVLIAGATGRPDTRHLQARRISSRSAGAGACQML